MKKRKLTWWVMGIPAVVLILILIIVRCEPEREGISRAVAAKSVALAVLSPEDLKKWKDEYGSSHFPAESLDEWYVPYLDYLYDGGYLDEEETPADEKHAEGRLTYGEAARIARTLSPSLEKSIKATKGNAKKPYPEKLWWLFYDTVLREKDSEGQVKKETLAIYGTPKNIPGAPAWTAYTSLGTLRFDGLNLDRYLDHELSAYVRGDEMIHVIGDQGQNTVYRNVWITDGDESEISVYLGDINRTIPFKKKSKKTEEIVHSLADLTMEDGRVAKVSLKKETITGKVLSVNEDAIEIEGYGPVPLDDEYKVLKIYGEIKRQKLSDILVGYETEEFVVAKGKICAVLSVRDLKADTIRVLLMDDGFKSLYHGSVRLLCDAPLQFTQGDFQQTIPAGKEICVSAGDGQCGGGRILLEPENGAEISVLSLNRAQGTPSYAGRLELIETENGLVLINELYLEDYLKKVVPSEMPAEYEKEALKAQAVCARTYAYMQLKSNTYSQYGAHVDDSTNFQVYNNIEPNGRTSEAVQETYGKMLLYEGSPVSAYYFSTSCGSTTNAAIWGSEPEDTPYLRALSLQPARKSLDLTDEEAFAAFIKQTDYPSYDASFPFYRWNVTTDGTILTAHIGGVGEVTEVKVAERGPGGVAQKLLVRGSEGERVIQGQNEIRAALGDGNLTIRRNDGKTSQGWSSLPSGFLTIEEDGVSDEGVKRFKIYGGGYGHGVGMSQNGAQGMAKAGIGYEEILKYFYDGATVGNL